jgi:hypothetical protein
LKRVKGAGQDSHPKCGDWEANCFHHAGQSVERQQTSRDSPQYGCDPALPRYSRSNEDVPQSRKKKEADSPRVITSFASTYNGVDRNDRQSWAVHCVLTRAR